MQIAICDDEQRCIDQVRAVMTAWQARRSDLRITVTYFSHPEDLLEAAEKRGGYDIYILDIVMPHMNGIQLGVRLRNTGYDGKVVYLTSSEEYALDSFRVRAFDYLIKPIRQGIFDAVMDEVVQSIAAIKDKHILVKTKTSSLKLNFEQILSVELSKRVLLFRLKGGKEVESTHLRIPFSEAVAELLADSRFFQCGVSTLVNLNRISQVEAEAVCFDDGSSLYLSKKLCRDLRGSWTEYLFREGSV